MNTDTVCIYEHIISYNIYNTVYNPGIFSLESQPLQDLQKHYTFFGCLGALVGCHDFRMFDL